MKQVIPIHGQDHELGGPDPLRPELPFVWGHDNALGQTVTANAELEFRVVRTNDQDTFAWDPDDPYGLVIIRRGLYEFYARVYGGAATPRGIYAACQPLSSGPGAGFGNAIGESITGIFELGPGSGAPYSVSSVDSGTPISKSALAYIGTARIAATVASPWRAVVALLRDGTDWSVGGTQSSLFIKRIGTYAGVEPPLPPSS